MDEFVGIIIGFILVALLVLVGVKSCKLISDKEETQQIKTYEPRRID